MSRTAQAESQSVHGAPCVPTVSLWTGRALSTLLVLFLLLDAVMKFVKPAPVLQACVQLGLPLNLVSTIGASLLVCSVLYAIPRTSILGAILLTGYFGGAVLSNLRVGNPLFTKTLFPVYFGALTWLGLYLRASAFRCLSRCGARPPTVGASDEWR
jgi:hypothetical protein